MEVFEAIFKRRTIRKFMNTPVEFEKLTEIISAGMHAPSSGNLQNWKFILITDKNKLRSLFHHTLEQEAFMTAQAGIIICSVDDIAEQYYGLRGKRLYAVQNCAAAIQNMLLAAQALKLGACWIGAFDEERVDSMFNIPGNARAQAIILVGYPDETPEDKNVKRIEDITFFNNYGEKVKKPHLILRDYSVEWQKIHQKMKLEAKEMKKPKFDTQKAKEKTKDFFEDTQKRISNVMKSLKDENK